MQITNFSTFELSLKLLTANELNILIQIVNKEMMTRTNEVIS